MSTRRSVTLSTLCLLAITIAVPPTRAQHGGHMGGAGSDHQQGQQGDMAGHMGDMHSDEMMEQMSTMMDHMSEMVGNMHEYHEQFAAMRQHQGHMGSADSEHDAMMQAMAAGMEEMLPHMDGMLKQVRSFMDEPHDGHVGEPVETLMKHMDTMLQAGRDVMATVHSMSGANPSKAPETDHSTHNH